MLKKKIDDFFEFTKPAAFDFFYNFLFNNIFALLSQGRRYGDANRFVSTYLATPSNPCF